MMKEKCLIRGKWDNEPDRAQFMYRGHLCLILRAPHSGHLNGYVALTRDHKMFQKDYMDIDCSVHGGITYGRMGYNKKHRDKPYYRPKYSRKHLGRKPIYWIGFDTAHYNDFQPYRVSRMQELGFGASYHDGEYRDMSYVTRELKQLVDQLVEINKGEM